MRALPLVSRPPVNIGHGLDYTGLDWIGQGLRCPMPSPLEDLGPRVGVVIETGKGMKKRGEGNKRERLVNKPCFALSRLALEPGPVVESPDADAFRECLEGNTIQLQCILHSPM
ncbi:hypothetical protein FOVG_08539 [Fusarium oxysporum f. sp. pisi HDV247]|uniref:Uncharacterized protein n=1 Tax=Fusarium oxysporum f. sp. pisi HDV247 TaxID=1080344 RepID=W9PKS3_FUSOX|nr:hypothetical protein FOVG_08539 [Fusarium oxysporum f. sp. pisi HDV247]